MKTTKILLLLALGACSKDNPYYCESSPDHNCSSSTMPDAPADTTNGCSASSECTSGALPVCDTANHTCVACGEGETGACGGTSPVCAEHACRACESHGECSTNACLPTGACGTAAEVVYVAPTGNDANACTQALPCKTITAAAAKGKPYVKASGAFDEAVTLNTVNVHILADTGTSVTRSTSIGPVFDIRGTSSVTIDDMIVRGAAGTTGNGIIVPPGEPVTLTLDHVFVLDNSAYGLNVQGGSLHMSRCTVSGNDSGGAMIVASLDITNSLFVRNGSSTSTTGGLTITPAGTSNVFRFNTVADNDSSGGTINFRGISCAGTLTVSSSIITGNIGSSSCTYDYALFDANATGTNRVGLPKFKAEDATVPLGADYFRLQSDSDAIDHADPNLTMSTDIDGDPRSSAKDIGADEFH